MSIKDFCSSSQLFFSDKNIEVSSANNSNFENIGTSVNVLI